MKKYLIVILTITLLGVFNVSFAWATTGILEGIVRDAETKKTLPGTHVKLEGSSPLVGISTDRNGKYSKEFPVGDYTFTYSFMGYKTVRKDIAIKVGKPKTMNVDLRQSIHDLPLFTITSTRKVEDILREEYRTISGKIYTASNDPLPGIGVNIREIDVIMKYLSDSINKTNDVIDNTENSERKAELQEKIKTAEEEKKKFKEQTKKVNGKYYFITDKNGKFEIKSKLIPNGKYNIDFVDLLDKYKNKRQKEEFKGNQSNIDLGLIGMYSDCESGNNFDADCLFPAWATKSDSQESSQEEIRGVYGKNQDGKAAMLIIPNIINIILKFISPIVVATFIYAGVGFVYAGADEERLKRSKDFFLYASIGLGLIIISYSIMKAIYFILK